MFTQEEIDNIIKEALDQAYSNFYKKKFESVVVILEQLLKIDPNNHEANQLLGISYHALKRHDDAKKYFYKCLEIQPENIETINNLALCYSSQYNYEKAIDLLQQALKISPESASILANLGLQYRHISDFEKAIECYKKSLVLRKIPTTLAMIGGCYGEMKNLHIAEKYIREAIDLEPNFDAAYIDLASILHLRGEWEEGFKAYEKRFDVFEQLKIWSKIYDPKDRWDGRDIKGKTLLVHMEQGNGDTIHFVRYLQLLKNKGIRIILHCSDVLMDICKDKADEIFNLDPLQIPHYEQEENKSIVPKHHFHCSLVSLPHLLKNPSIPTCPYINIDKNIDMSSYEGMYKIGIVWAGNAQHPNDRYRSCKLEEFREIYNLPNVKLFSLMKDYRARTYDGKTIIDLSTETNDMKIVDMSSYLTTYYETAKIINSLDLVVGVDTSVIHLAGAMKKPTLCLLPWNPDWRWGIEGKRTIWYPSVKLIRQEKRGIWKEPFDKALKIIKKACGYSTRPYLSN